ncbi:MAG: PEP-CTERM sorting domain-containing protein [Pirellulales bacterium]|nr:PEP-CTERM sorting domain-containing protein [Pirellulales bacterium]
MAGGESVAFVYDGTSYVTLNPPFGDGVGTQHYGYAEGISGDLIVGNVHTSSPGNRNGFLYDGETFTGPFFYQFYGIGDNKIVGTFVSKVNFGNPSYTGFVATIPEPSSLALGIAGAIGLWLFVRRVRAPGTATFFGV